MDFNELKKKTKTKNNLQAKAEFCLPKVRLNTEIDLVISKLNALFYCARKLHVVSVQSES